MVEPKFGPCQQYPEKLLARVLGPVGALSEVGTEDAYFLVVGRPREHVAHGQVDQLGLSGGLFQTPGQPARSVGQDVATDPLPVAEEQPSATPIWASPLELVKEAARGERSPPRP